MSGSAAGNCRKPSCANAIPAALATEQLCLDHFLDEAFQRTDTTFDRCRKGAPMQPGDLEWLLTDALAVVKNLEEGASEPDAHQRDRMLELLLILANLHEYVAHHSVRLDRPA